MLTTIRNLLKPRQMLFVDVTDPIDPKIGSPEVVRDRVLEAAEFIPVLSLGTSDDCESCGVNEKKEMLWLVITFSAWNWTGALAEARGHFRRQHTLGSHRNHIVLILQDAFNRQKAFAGQQQTIAVKKSGRDDGIGHTGFIFQTDKDKSLGSAWTLANDDATSNANPSAAGNVAQFAGAANAHGREPCTAVSHGMRSHGEAGAVKVGD